MFLRLTILFLAPLLWANTPKTQIWSTFKELSGGDFQNLVLDSSGQLQTGHQTTILSKELPPGVIAIAPYSKSKTYVATMAPGVIWELASGQKPKAVFEIKNSMLTHMFAMPNGELALVSGPSGGVTYVLPGSWDRSRHVEVPGMIYGAHQNNDTLLLVGDNGFVHSVTGAHVEKKPVLAPEPRLRSVFGNYYGSADTGTVYKDQEPMLKLSGEVVAITGEPKSKNIFVAVNLSKSASQIWRVSPNGDKCMVWESNAEIIYTLKVLNKKLYWGTGPTAHLYESPFECNAKVSILASFLEHQRVVDLAARGNHLLMATGDKGAVYDMDLDSKAPNGKFGSPVVKLDAPSVASESSGELWMGNTDKRDTTWWKFDSNKSKQGQYAQVEQNIAQPTDKVYLRYETPEKPVTVKAVTVSKIEPHLIQAHIELSPKTDITDTAYQFVLESLNEETTIIQPFAKTLSVTYDTTKVSKGTYRVVVYSEKDKSISVGASEWFELP